MKKLEINEDLFKLKIENSKATDNPLAEPVR